MTSENGGGAFVLIYIVSVIVIALPIMIAEVFIGRHGKQNPVDSLKFTANEYIKITKIRIYLSV